MNNKAKEAYGARMSKFIEEKDKEVQLLIQLLDVQNGVKRLKREDLDEDNESINSAFFALRDCSKLQLEFLNNPDSGVNCLGRFIEEAKIAVGFIRNLKKKINFFRDKIFGDVLEDLEKATIKFKETAG